MRDITTAMKNYLATDAPTLVTCWQITTRDGSVVRSTDFSQPVVFDGNTYLARHGAQRTAIEFTSDLKDENLQASGFVDIAAPRSELAAGRFDGATIKIFQINPYDPSMGKIDLMAGRLGEIRIEDNVFTTSISSRLAEFKLSQVEVTSPECRAKFGDSRCGINVASHTVTGTVTAVNSGALSVSTGLTTGFDLAGGLLTWTSGANVGAKNDVKAFAAGTLTLHFWPMYEPQVGDAFSVVRGCNKLFATCRDTFNNKANFRGEPDIPGSTALYRIAGKKA